MKPSENLARAKALIEDPKRWVRGSYCRVLNGVECYCALGALGKVTFDEPHVGDRVRSGSWLEWQYLEQSAKKHCLDGVVSVNDHLGHKAVLAMYDRAIELAEEQGH